MFGDRALYNESWLANTKVMRAPWVHAVPKVTFAIDRPKLSPVDVKKHQAARNARKATE